MFCTHYAIQTYFKLGVICGSGAVISSPFLGLRNFLVVEKHPDKELRPRHLLAAKLLLSGTLLADGMGVAELWNEQGLSWCPVMTAIVVQNLLTELYLTENIRRDRTWS